MQKTFITYFTALLSLFTGLSVIMSSAHSKDVVAQATDPQLLLSLQKAQSDDASHAKVTAELHNHIEKQTLKTMVKHVSDQAPQADAKSLKRVTVKLKKQSTTKRHSYRFPRLLTVLRLFRLNNI